MTDDSRAPGGATPDDGRVHGPNAGDEDAAPSLTDQLLVSGPPRYEGMAPPDPEASSYGEEGRPYGSAGVPSQGGPTTMPDQDGRPGLEQAGPGYAAQGGQPGLDEGRPAYAGQNGRPGLEQGGPGYAPQNGQPGLDEGRPAYAGQNGRPGLEQGGPGYAPQ
ncbi:hypothetical protein AB0L00_06720, partial [Actinoallomurus sp. NPDC052308]